MVGQYVLLLVTVVLGTIAGGMAIGCRTLRDWSWLVVVGALIFLGAAAMLAAVTRRVPGNVPARSARDGETTQCYAIIGAKERTSAGCSELLPGQGS
jgi:protein-S-isoprenylcysteine O-methyltransferase Ste14